MNVKTVFHQDTDNKVKVEFEQRIALHSSQSWIQVPKFLQTANEGVFHIKIPSVNKKKSVLFLFEWILDT